MSGSRLNMLFALTISGLSLILVSNEIGYKVKWLDLPGGTISLSS